MFDNLKFTLADSKGNPNSTKFTALGLISLLCRSKFLTKKNAYSFLIFLSVAEPKAEYKGDNFTVIALPH